MIGAAALLGFLLGGMAGFLLAYTTSPANLFYQILLMLSLGGTAGTFAAVAAWYATPSAFRNALRASRTGVLIVAVGADKKLRLLPGKSDGFVIRPVDKPYREKYVWAADGESAYPIHNGKGIQAIITFMGYPFPLEVRKAAAVSKFREKGFKSIEDLKTAIELPSREDVEKRISELERLKETVAGMDASKVSKEFGASKEQVLAEINAELERLARIKEAVKHGGGDVTVNVDGATVRASDLISYLVWRHHPAELERIVKAETNAVLARMSAIDWIKQLIPVIIVAGMIVLAILAAIYMLGHGGSGAGPAHTITIGGG